MRTRSSGRWRTLPYTPSNSRAWTFSPFIQCSQAIRAPRMKFVNATVLRTERCEYHVAVDVSGSLPS